MKSVKAIRDVRFSHYLLQVILMLTLTLRHIEGRNSKGVEFPKINDQLHRILQRNPHKSRESDVSKRIVLIDCVVVNNFVRFKGLNTPNSVVHVKIVYSFCFAISLHLITILHVLKCNF